MKNMQMRRHRGFVIQVYGKGEGFIAEVYHRGKLIHTARSDGSREREFHSAALVTEAAREWIDHTYPKGKIKYFGEVE
jgi:hypothetical protein